MKRAVALALVLTSAVALAIVAGRAEAVPAKPAKSTAGSLTGAGATFPFPLISKWIPAVDQALGIKLTYASVGSGAGIAQITARTVDFGASDAPLTPDQLLMLEEDNVCDPQPFYSTFGLTPIPLATGLRAMLG